MVFNSQTAVAFARLFVTLLISVASGFGWALDADILLNIVLSAASVALFIGIWWKNNNVTEAAQEAQKVLDELKNGETVEIKVGGSDD